MRALISAIAIAAAASAPAVGQTYGALVADRDAGLIAQADAARRRDVELTNQLSVLDAQGRTDQAMRDIQATQRRPALPAAVAPPPGTAAPRYAEIPDGMLAASTERARAAARNRR